MTPERYRQIGEICRAALKVEAEERATFIAQAGAGDDAKVLLQFLQNPVRNRHLRCAGRQGSSFRMTGKKLRTEGLIPGEDQSRTRV